MTSGKIEKRFFESTRGRIVTLLRRKNMTVKDLADNLGLTHNAVRAQLLSLERDGLVLQRGMVKGFRKPHYIYGLAEKARDLFPRPYDFLFNRLLTSLKDTFTKATLFRRLRDVGKAIGRENATEKAEHLNAKLERALKAIESLGGSAAIVNENGVMSIRSESCPFAEAVAEHPEVCKVSESMIEEIVGVKVTEVCDRSSSPQCHFQIKTA
jgi:predicted ArsR family transcriptional regulator